MASSRFSSDTARWAAVRAKDCAAEGSFVYCVKTTKIYCRPTCKARLARRANVEFFDTGSEAQAAGYRACKRCKPELTKYVPEADQMIEKVRSILEDLPKDSPLPKLDDMAAQAGLTKYHFHRQFKKATGLTPREYTLSRRRSEQTRLRWDIADLANGDAISTPPLLLDTAASSTSHGTPATVQTPDFAMEDWLIPGLDGPVLFDDCTYPFGPADGNIDNFVTESAMIDLNKELAPDELTTPTVYYSTVETTHGVLMMAFEEGQIFKLELVATLHEAVISLANSFPAPFYLLVSVDELGMGHKSCIIQQIFALVQALENPPGTTYDPSISLSTAVSSGS